MNDTSMQTTAGSAAAIVESPTLEPALAFQGHLLDELRAASTVETCWLWQGFVAAGNLTLLTSQWKSGKTTLVSVLLSKMKTGGKLAGLQLAAGKAAVVSEEALSTTTTSSHAAAAAATTAPMVASSSRAGTTAVSVVRLTPLRVERRAPGRRVRARRSERTGMAEESARIDTRTGFARTVAFSDGVFAIAITLLVLSIDVPTLHGSTTPSRSPRRCGRSAPRYWRRGARLTGLARPRGAPRFAMAALVSLVLMLGLLWLNLLYLSFIGLLPFSTALLGDFGNDPTALTAYAINVGLAGLADALMLTVALRAHLLEPDKQARGAQLLARDLTAPAVFFASIPLAYADTSLAKYSWLLIAIVPRVLTRVGVFRPRRGF